VLPVDGDWLLSLAGRRPGSEGQTRTAPSHSGQEILTSREKNSHLGAVVESSQGPDNGRSTNRRKGKDPP
jgi:hypothetical protein